VGVVREDGPNPYTGANGYAGYYVARRAPGLAQPYDEWELSGDIGPKGTYHTYGATWDGAGWDIKIDGVTKITAHYNGIRAYDVYTGIENLHCFPPGGGTTSWSNGTEQKGWRWRESNGTERGLRVPIDYVQLPGHLIRFTDVNDVYYVCSHLNTDDWCDDD